MFLRLDNPDPMREIMESRLESRMKLVRLVFVVAVGAVVTAGIDMLLGMDFSGVGALAAIGHKVAYLAWGGALAGALSSRA